MNWYVESSEGEGQAPAALYPTPGTKLFADLANSPVRGIITANDRTFAVGGSRFFEIHSDGTLTNFGALTNDGSLVSFAVGSSQILIASAGVPYVFDFSSGLITASTLGVGGNNGIASSSLGVGGTGYGVGDEFTVESGNKDATGIVDSVGGGGAVATYHLTSVGTGYSAGTFGTSNDTGTGSGLTIDILTLGGGYAINDTGTVNGGSVLATYKVLTVDANGNVLTYSIVTKGAGYSVATGLGTQTGGTQPGIGAGFTINVGTTGTANTFNPLPGGTLLAAVSFVTYVEGLFVALLVNSNQFQWSAPLDATSWDPLDTDRVSVFVGNVLSMFADHNELWFFGERQTQPYQLTGSANVFDTIPGAFIEAGIYAATSPVRLDNSIFWLGGDERGAGIVWRANGYTPQRVSNHAVEFAIQGYLTTFGSAGVSTAVGYSYQDQGHGFYVLYFPLPSATWVYDVATGMWHQRGFWNATNGMFTAHHSQVHTFNFGQHLVGDWSSGKVYSMSISNYDDAGNPIRRVRRTRHASADQSWVFFQLLQIYVETGVGPTPPLLDGGGNPREPMLNLRWSNDGGHVWSNELSAGIGMAGQYGERVIFRRLGRGRTRVWEVSASDPVPYRLINAYLKLSAGEGA